MEYPSNWTEIQKEFGVSQTSEISGSMLVFGGVSVSWFRSSESQTSGLEGASNGTTFCKCWAVWWKTDPPKTAQNNLSYINGSCWHSCYSICFKKNILYHKHINPHQSTPFLDAGEKLGDKNFVLLHKQQYLRWNWTARIIIHNRANLVCVYILYIYKFMYMIYIYNIIELYARPKQYVM